MKNEAILPREFGQGWLSKEAANLIKIAVAVAGFDIKDIMKHLPKTKGQVINARTVSNVLQRLRDEPVKEWNTYTRRPLTEANWNTYQKTAPIIAKQMSKPFRVTTKEGPASGKAGDYLCVGVENEMWPVDKSIFEKTMKKVVDGPYRNLKEAVGYDLSTMSAKELRLLHLRLIGKALKAIPSSPRQKDIRKELEKVHAELKRRGPRWQESLSEATLYHVTHTKLVPKIRRDGLLPLQPTNWKMGSGERYGQAGEVFAFTDLFDAIRWAAKMDWDFNQGTGTGKISVLTLDSTKEKWQTDTADPMSQAGIRGRWVKTVGHIPPEQIKKATPLTSAMVKKLVANYK